MKRFTCVRYFQSLLWSYFMGIESTQVSIEMGVEDFKSVDSIKGVKIWREVCIDSIS